MMAISAEYLEYLKELLEYLPRLRVKRMFGGAGFYSDERFFAIATDDGLYLKADAESEPFYRRGGAKRFTYQAKGKTTHLNFWSVPADVLEDPDELERWSHIALDAALRARK